MRRRAHVLEASFFSVLLLLGVAGCPDRGAGAGRGALSVKGSDTMVQLGTAWAEAFMKARPEVSVAVTGGGSGTGIAALANGTCDVAQCSRPIKPEESAAIQRASGRKPSEIAVALDALVVAVHPRNPVPHLSFDQLSRIYTGKVTNWKSVGGPDRPITVIARESNSGTHVYFLEHVVRLGRVADKGKGARAEPGAPGTEEYAPGVLFLPSSQAIVDEVSSNEGAVGYFGLGYLGVKNRAVALSRNDDEKPVGPSLETVLDTTYPLSRSLFWYVAGEVTGDARSFVEFALSDEGQRIVKRCDFAPLRAVKD